MESLVSDRASARPWCDQMKIRSIVPVPILASSFAIRAIATSPGQDQAQPRYAKEIAAFEEADRLNPPPRNAVLFVGGSSILLWDLSRSFPGLPVINRGFGGSHVED